MVTMSFQCAHCFSFCPLGCFAMHKEAFSCHNQFCPGTTVMPPQLIASIYYQMAQIAQQIRQGPEPSNIQHLVLSQYGYTMVGFLPPPPPPMHIQYLINGMYSPVNHDIGQTAFKTQEYKQGEFKSSETGPVWRQSAAEMLKKQPSISRIKKGLYIGNLACIQTEGFLEAMGITAVVTVLSRHPGHSADSPLDAAIPLEDQLYIQANDHRSEDIIQHFPVVCEFINKRLADNTDDYDIFDEELPRFVRKSKQNRKYNKEQRVLVHCRAGISRSVTVTTAYLMHRHRQGVKEALDMVKESRPIAKPNAGFIKQLEVWRELHPHLYWGNGRGTARQTYEMLIARLRMNT